MQCPPGWAVAPGHRVGQDVLHGLGARFLPFSDPAMSRTAVPGQGGEESGLHASHPQCCSRRRAPSSWSEFCASGKPAVHPPGASSTGRADLAPALQETTDAEGSGQDTPCQDRGPMCGMTGLEETHPEQGGWGPVFPPPPTPASPSVEPETRL